MSKLLVLILVTLAPCVSAHAADAVLSWTAITQDVNGSPVTGVQYRVHKASGGLLTTTTALTFTVANYVESCWYVVPFTTDREAPKSNVVCKTAPLPTTVTTVR